MFHFEVFAFLVPSLIAAGPSLAARQSHGLIADCDCDCVEAQNLLWKLRERGLSGAGAGEEHRLGRLAFWAGDGDGDGDGVNVIVTGHCTAHGRRQDADTFG